MSIVHKQASVADDLLWYIKLQADEGSFAPKALYFAGDYALH